MTAVRRWLHAPDLPLRLGLSASMSIIAGVLCWAAGHPAFVPAWAGGFWFFMGWGFGRDDYRSEERTVAR
jgi:hypothetical protein